MRKNVQWGVLWGLYLAAAFTVIAAIPALIRAVTGPATGWQKGVTFLEIIGVYLFGGVVAGAIVGLLRGATKWWLGRRVVGIIASVPIMFAVRVAVYGPHGWTRADVENWLLTAVIWGIAMSFAPEPWAKEAEQERRAEGGER